MPDDFEEEPSDETKSEGVRILGAEEAQAAVEASSGRASEEPPRPRREAPPDAKPAARFPLPTDGPSEFDVPVPRPTPAPPPAPPPAPTTPTVPTASTGEASGPVPLPHWTEPPTGEVPMIPSDEADDIFATSGSTPRFRGEGDWSETDFADFDDEPVHDEDSGELGALVDVPDIDDDELFAAEVAARRPPSRRTRARAGGAATAGAYGATESTDRPARPSIARDDFTTRIITGAVLAAVGLLAFALGRAATAVLITAIVAVAALEIYEGFRRAGFQPATLIGLGGSAALVGIAYNYGERAFPLVSAVVLAFTLFWYLAKVVHARPMVNAAVTMLGYSYVGVLGGFAGLLLVYPDGVGMIIGLVICAVGYDIVGYLVGSRIGRRPLAPDVSPNKTVEGLLAGMGASIVLGAIVAEILGLTPWNSLGDGLLLGLVVAIFAPLGDLCESMIKRDLGLKDLGTLLPGHGGVLDRFDAMLFCLPAVYYLVLARGLV